MSLSQNGSAFSFFKKPPLESVIFLSIFILISILLSFRLVTATEGSIDFLQLINILRIFAIPILLLETPLITIFAWRSSKHARTIAGRITHSIGFTLLYILLLAVLAVGNQFVDNQMIVTKTYTNIAYAFQIKYPSAWTAYERIESKTGKGIITVFLVSPPFNNNLKSLIDSGGDPSNALRISIGSKYPTEILQLVPDSFCGLPGCITHEQITFKGLSAQKSYTTSTDFGSSGNTDIVFNKGNYGWIISYPTTDLKGTHNQIYDQILSTFKFTN